MSTFTVSSRSVGEGESSSYFKTETVNYGLIIWTLLETVVISEVSRLVRCPD